MPRLRVGDTIENFFYENAKGESALRDVKPYDRFQFMRMGYYSAVGTYGKDGKYEFNQITGLKDSYGK